MKRLTAYVLLTTLMLPAVATSAQAPPTWGKLFPAIAVTTDYRFNGGSLSDRDPAVQVSLHWWHPSKLYAGLWASSVDFNDPHDTSIEWDLYAGRRFDLGDTELRLEGMYTSYDDAEAGPTYDFVQAKVHLERRLGDVTVGTSVSWSPAGAYGAGQTWQLRGEASKALTEWLSVSAMVGRGVIERRKDRSYWDAGFTVHWRPLSLDIRYVATDLSFSECGYVDWCEPGMVGTIALATY